MHEDGVPQLPENQAGWDRVLRIALGVSIFVFGLSGVFAEPVAGAIRLASLIPMATGAFGWCPVYALFGVSTRRDSDDRHAPGRGGEARPAEG